MPSARDLWVILRAQDQASRALNSFSRAVRSAGTDAMLAQLQARKGAEAAALGQNQLAQAGLRNEIAQLGNENAMIRTNVAQAKLGGTTKAYLDAQKAAIIANEREIQIRRDMIIGHQDEALAVRDTIQRLEGEIATRKNAIGAIKDHEEKMQKFSQTLQSASQMATTLGIGLAAVGVVGAVAIGSLIKASAEYDRQARLTSTQVAGMGEHLQEIKDIGLRVAHDIGVGFDEIQPALYDIFSSMNVGVADGEKLLTQFAKAAVAGQTDIQSVSRGTIAVMNSMQLGVEDITRILDVQFKFIQKGVGTYDEWAKRIGLVAPSANRAGQSIETMMASLAAASKMSGVAARAGTAVARSFDAFSNPAAVAKLKALGVAATDTKGNFRPFVDVMFDFRNALDKVEGGQVGKMKVILDVFKGAGGTIEARRFLQQLLLVPGVLEDMNGIYKETTNASGSLDQAYATMSESISAKTEKLKNRFKELKIQLGDLLGPAFGKLLDIGNQVLDWFTRLDPKTQKMIVYFGLAVTAVSLLFGGILLLVGAVAGVAAAFAVAGLSIGGVLLVVGLLTLGFVLLIAGFVLVIKHFKDSYDHSEKFRKAIQQLKDDVKAFIDEFKKRWKEHVQPALDETAKIIKEKIKPAWEEFTNYVSEVVLKKLDEFVKWAKDNINPVMKEIGRVIKEEVNPQLSKLGDWWKENKDWVKPLIKDTAELTKQLMQLAAILGVFSGINSLHMLGGELAMLNFSFTALGYVIKGQLAMWKVEWDLAKEAWNGFWKFVKDSAKWMEDAWNRLKDWWNSGTLTKPIHDAFEEIKGIVTGALNTIQGALDTFFGGANEKTSTGMGGIKTKFSFGMEDVKNIVNSSILATTGIFGTGIDNIITKAGGMSGIKNIFSGAIEGGRQAIDLGVNKVTGIFEALPNRIIHAMPNPGGLLWAIGQAIVDGLTGGINSKSANAAESAARMATNAYTAAKNAIGAKSPSRAFMQLGKYAVDGFSLGLTENMRKFVPNLQAQFSVLPVLAGGAMTPQPVPVTRNATFNITVNQADRSARQLAQDLGQELAGML